MRKVPTPFLALIGLTLFGYSIYLGTRHQSNVGDQSTQTGEMRWVLPPEIQTRGARGTFLGPRVLAVFSLSASYPESVSVREGFYITLESKLESLSIVPEYLGQNKDQVIARARERYLKNGYNRFVLDLPGLNFSPTDPTEIGVDGKVRWQVAPPRESGSYFGYISPSGNSGESKGAQWLVTWENKKALEVQIDAYAPLFGVSDLKSLLIGLLGSVLTFPALLSAYDKFRRKNANQ